MRVKQSRSTPTSQAVHHDGTLAQQAVQGAGWQRSGTGVHSLYGPVKPSVPQLPVLTRQVRAVPELYYLDFFDQLLTPDGEGLIEGLALDGTHLHPSYLRFMEAVLPQ